MKQEVTIGVTTVAFSKNDKLVKSLKEIGFGRIKINEEGKRFKKNELIDFLRDCQGAIIGLDKIDREILDQLPNLKVISKYGVGLDNINLNDASAVGVKVLHKQGVNKRSVSELTLGFILSLSRNLYVTSNQLKSGEWNKSGGHQLSEKTVGIIGVGHVGKDLVQLLKPFNCRILVNDVIDQRDYYAQEGLIEATKEEIYEKSDVITIHTPLNKETQDLIGKQAFSKMKNSAIVINTARGGIINQIDLKNALKNHDIAGAAIDAYEIEPPEDDELIKMPNLINTPHIGGNALEAVEAMGVAAIDNLCNYFR